MVIDWLDKYGGAERVIGKLQHIFNFHEVYTLVNIMPKEDLNKMFPLKSTVIKETFLKKFGKRFRLAFFFFYSVIKKISISKDVNIIISSSHSVAKGVKKSNPNQIHISYFQARNSNYIWEEYDLYFGKLKYIFYPIIYFLRKKDVLDGQNPDYIICNSKFVQTWVKNTYKRESIIIYPPVDLSKFTLQIEKDDYYVAVGRIVSIKRFDILVKAFRSINKKLILIGDGNEFETIKKLASENVIITGFLNSEEVNEYVKYARAFIQTGVEGFGIAPVEAQACGTPVIAFGGGGALETIIENKTGIFFDKQTPESLIDAVNRFEKMQFNPIEVRENALRFSKERFEQEIKTFVEEKWQEHLDKNNPDSLS